MAEKETKTDAQNTQEKDSEVDWEKRYKDLQSETTPVQQKLAEAEKKAAEYEQTLQAVSPFVNWDAAQKKESPTNDEGEYITKEQYKKDKDVADITMYFRTNDKYRDLQGLDNEKMVGTYLTNLQSKNVMGKSLNQLLDEAVKLARAYKQHIKDEALADQQKEKEVTEQAEKEKAAKEAAASGLESQRATEEPSSKEETPQGYADSLRTRQEKQKLTHY